MSIPDSTKNPKDWKITNDLIEQIRRYEQESNKSAIWRNKITGIFLYFKYMEEHPEFLEEKEKAKAERAKKLKKTKKNKIEPNIEELEKKEVEDEENELLDAIEDYKAEYHVKKVNTKSKKFKTFFEEWKNSE